MDERPGRLVYVDGLRGVAALMVFLAHARSLLVSADTAGVSDVVRDVIHQGGRGVELFFVISGFAIAYSLRDATRETFGVGAFMARRFVRLAPPYWCSILALFAARAILSTVAHRPLWTPSLPRLAAHLVYLQSILGYEQLRGVYWTLCIELQLYLAFGLVLMATLRLASGDTLHRTLLPAVVTSGLIASLVLAHTVWPAKVLETWFVPYWYMFLAGVLVCWQLLGRVSRRHVMTCLGLMVAACVLRPGSVSLAAILAVAALELGLWLNKLHVWLGGRVAQTLGRLSYATYLLHVPVLMLVGAVRRRVAPTSELASLLTIAAAFALTIVAAHILYVTVEVPCLRLSARLKKGASPLLRSVRRQRA